MKWISKALPALLLAATPEEKATVAVAKYGTATGPAGTNYVSKGMVFTQEAITILAVAVIIVIIAALIVFLTKK